MDAIGGVCGKVLTNTKLFFIIVDVNECGNRFTLSFVGRILVLGLESLHYARKGTKKPMASIVRLHYRS